ncbi:MAG: SUMF1/EgtB/PvdO family nonheme iron enzyme [Draconibacterium sp.]|nr:SUMF1/EgtB/PvdO family nonheme iron enzyme [Draconibacterium sp.]
MKKLILIAFVLWSIFIFTGCSKSGNGELVGVQNRPKWREAQPYGMVFVRKGSFNIGPSDQDASTAGIPTKTVSQEAFWMDDTEITNNEYRQFVSWVKDSIARKMLGDTLSRVFNH